MLATQLEGVLVRAATENPVVSLTGPRQSGKTTLVRRVFPDHDYRSLEAPDLRARALEDPRGFLGGSDRMILDEVQRAPELSRVCAFCRGSSAEKSLVRHNRLF